YSFFFFQAEDGIRDFHVTGVQTCALPIFVLVVYYGKYGAAHRNSRFALMSRFFPGFFVGPDLFGLLNVKRLPALVILQGRTLEVHTDFCRPDGGSIRSRTPPNTVTQSF